MRKRRRSRKASVDKPMLPSQARELARELARASAREPWRLDGLERRGAAMGGRQGLKSASYGRHWQEEEDANCGPDDDE